MAILKPANPAVLYEDLIYEILLRLPVKALLRFKSVCKLWLSIISSTRFIKSHLSESTHNPQYSTHHRLILCQWIRCHCIGKHADPRTCSIYSLFNESNIAGVVDERLTEILDDVPVTVARHKIDGDKKVKGVVGYCNGLVCLISNYGPYDLYLWNPATRKARKLPNLAPSNIEFEDIYENHYGFCYDALNDDFKVYAIYNGLDSEYEVSVYSSKSDCWRLIGDFPFGDVLDAHPVIFANGALHWMVVKRRSDDYEELHIISLDINTEIYREIFQPTNIGGEDDYRLHLGIFGKSLSLLYKFDDYADFWVFNGVEEIWTKLFTIPYMDRLTMFYRIKPICITVNGDILLQFDSTILLYNSKDKTFKDLIEINFCQDSMTDMYCKADVYTYFESLVSP